MLFLTLSAVAWHNWEVGVVEVGVWGREELRWPCLPSHTSHIATDHPYQLLSSSVDLKVQPREIPASQTNVFTADQAHSSQALNCHWHARRVFVSQYQRWQSLSAVLSVRDITEFDRVGCTIIMEKVKIYCFTQRCPGSRKEVTPRCPN